MKQSLAGAALLVVLSAAAAWYVFSHGCTLYYGDAEAHLNIARRWIDSRTPGPAQLGTAWLPLPHLLMTPFVVPSSWGDKLWRNGLAGAIPAAISFVVAGLFLFASARLIFADRTGGAAWAAIAVFALNPNMLYLQSIPMTESIFAAALMALLWATLRYRRTPKLKYVLAAAVASIAASLTRYEGWFLIPFVTLFFFLTKPALLTKPAPNVGGSQYHALVFAVVAALGPLAWLAHNQFYYSDALAFYRGPYSALAIYRRQLAQGLARYPGDHHWTQAFHYYFAAVRATVGWPVVILAVAGIAFVRKPARWPLFLLALPPLFYVMSIHSSGTPVYVPDLWPFSWYNTRYGLAALPLIAFSVASLSAFVGGGHVRLACATIAVITFLSYASRAPITFKESQVNSIARRAWTAESAAYLKSHAEPDASVIYSFGDLTGVLRQSGMQLRQGLHQDNGVAWDTAILRPDLFLHDEFALAIADDPVSIALRRAQKYGLPYDLVQRITVPGAPAVEIYRRRPLDQNSAK